MGQPTEYIRQEATNYDLTLLQDRLQSFFAVLDNCPLLDGRLVSGVELIAGIEVSVEHGLGRLPQGWFVADKMSVSGDIARTNSWDELFLPLTSPSTQTVSLWVF